MRRRSISPPVPKAQSELRRAPNVQGKVVKSKDYHSAVQEQQIKDILYLLLILRFINAIAVQTFFQPDEYFQSLEPAWQMAFGPSSGAWITWVSILPLFHSSMVDIRRNGNISYDHPCTQPSLRCSTLEAIRS